MENGNQQPTRFGTILQLSDEQRLDLFYQTGLYLRRLGYNSHDGTTQIIDRNCTTCLLADDLPGISILADGRCNKCHAFEQRQNEGNFDPANVQRVISACKGKSEPDCVLAFSGGKDSAAALLTAVHVYGLHPVAVLVDNGFIPQEVIDSSQKFCGNQSVPLLVRKIEIRDYTRQSLQKGVQAVPCHSCMKQVFNWMADTCKEFDTNLVIGGHRFPPLTFSVQAYTGNPAHRDIMCISPLLALRIEEKRQLQWISEAGWKPIEIAGNTSNCKLIGYVEERFSKEFGYNPHIYEVSKEIRAGFYSREAGVKKIENHHISDEHRRDVEQKLMMAEEVI